MKADKNQHKSVQTTIINALKQRLCINNIYREFELITNMTRNLEIKFKIFAKLEPIKHLTKEKIIQIIKYMPFLTYLKTKERDEQQQYIKINYQHSNKILLVTGITKEAIQQMVKQFNQWTQTNNYHTKLSYSKIIATNGFWVTIETHTQETAAQLKKFLRGKKRINDHQSQEGYKVQGRRIRIVILKEDFLSILIDAMTEIKSQIFFKQFSFANPSNQRRKSQDQTIIIAQSKKKGIIYKSILLNPYHSKSDIKDEEFSDGFSQSNSLSSDILDSNKIKDLIQTSDQGIQSQNNGQFTQDHIEKKEQEQVKKIQEENVQIPIENKQATLQRTKIISSQTIEHVDNQPITKQQTFLLNQKLNEKQKIKESLSQEIIHISKNNDEEINKLDNPFIASQLFAAPEIQSTFSTAIQAQQVLLSNIPFTTMKRFFQQFKNSKNTTLFIELPTWAKSQSEQQRNRHRFFGSLCSPKIVRKRLAQQ